MNNPPPKEQNIILDGQLILGLQNLLDGLFAVTEWETPRQAKQGTVIFRGKLLLQDADQAYEQIANRWERLDYTPFLREGESQLELIANPGLVVPEPSNPWINLILFMITFFSMLLVGSVNEGVNPLENPIGLAEGLPFTLSFLAILGAHEFGHYFAARYHKVAVTLPYFIPFPTIWGTMGAVIQLRSPTLTRKQLFDVGVAGPLAGIVVAVPVLLIGLSLSLVEPLPDLSSGAGYIMEGNSIFYWLSKYLVFGQGLPSADGLDVMLHPLAWAGWSGLFLTVMNLLPVGQLDGGHVSYVLFGRYARWLGFGTLLGMGILGATLWAGWFFPAVLIFLFIGVDHPPPLNDVSPVGTGRKALGYMIILIFILLFVPIPLEVISA